MMELWNLFDVIYVDKSLELEIKTLCSRLSIPKIVKHRSHVHNLRARRGPERRESGPRQDSLPFIAAINRRYDYHTQYVDIFTKWAARFRVKYQNRPPPSTSYYCSRLSNVLILQTCIMYGNCSVCRVARCPGVLPVLYT